MIINLIQNFFINSIFKNNNSFNYKNIIIINSILMILLIQLKK